MSNHPNIANLEWWTVREVANRWRCSINTVTRHIAAGRLKGMKSGGWRVHKSAIEAFEKGAKVSAPPVRNRPVPDVLGLYEVGISK